MLEIIQPCCIRRRHVDKTGQHVSNDKDIFTYITRVTILRSHNHAKVAKHNMIFFCSFHYKPLSLVFNIPSCLLNKNLTSYNFFSNQNHFPIKNHKTLEQCKKNIAVPIIWPHNKVKDFN
jgi:hypothetical protein